MLIDTIATADTSSQLPIETIINEINSLISLNLLSSALELGLLYYPSHKSNISLITIISDTLFKLGQYKRAINYYSLILQTQETKNVEYDKVKLKIAKCYFELKDYSTCKTILQTVRLIDFETNFRFEYNLLMAKCLENLDGNYSVYYGKASELQPFAIVLYPKKSKQVSTNSLVDELQLIDKLIYTFNYEEALKLITANSIPFLKRLFIVYYKIGKYEDCLNVYQEILGLDSEFDELSCEVGFIYFGSGNILQLNKLANCDNKYRWFLLGLWCESKSLLDKALNFYNESLNILPNHVLSLLSKGKILISQEKHKEALVCFKKAHKIEQDVYTFESLLNCLLLMNKTKDALYYCKDLALCFGTLPRALVCIGRVLEKSGEMEKAKKAFEGALFRDYKCVDAFLGIVELFCKKGQFGDAVLLMEKYKDIFCCDWMFCKLGDVYLLQKDYLKAFYWYHSCLGLNPEYEKAKSGIGRVDKILRGDDESEGHGGDEEDLDDEDEEM